MTEEKRWLGSRRVTAVSLAALAVAVLGATLALQAGYFEGIFVKAPAAPLEQPFAKPTPIFGAEPAQNISSGEWPQLFGPTRDSISREQNVATEWPETGPPVLWKRDVGTGYSSPVVASGRLVLAHRIGDEELIDCLQADTGSPIWTARFPTSYRCKFEHGSGPYSTPIIDGDTVYVLSAEGMLRRLSFQTGNVEWERNLTVEFGVPENIFAVGHTPLVEGDRLILNVGGTVGDSGIVALDKSTGQTIWGATNEAASYATPTAATIHGRRYLFVMTADGLVSLDPADGKVHWSIPIRAKQADTVNATTPLVYGDVVLASVYQAGTLCVRVLADGSYEELWRRRRQFECQFNPLVCIDGFVYGWHFFDQSFRCFELTTGRPKWTYKSLVSRGTHIAVDGRLILFGEQGNLASVDVNPEQLIVRSETPNGLLEPSCFSAPALAGGLLYLRNEIQLLCLDLRLRSQP